MRIAFAERKGEILASRGSLPCLHDVPCINVTRGCAHECSYCWSRTNRFSSDGPHLIVYTNAAEKLRQELAQHKHHPATVYLCPACDPFQPVRQALAVTYETMRVLLEHRIGVLFSTVGAIPPAFLELFARYPRYVRAQVNLTTTVRAIQKVLERHAAPPAKRLENIQRLKDIGVAVEVGIEPLVPALTDIELNLNKLLSDLAPMAPLKAVVSYMLLRGHVEENLRATLGAGSALRRVMNLYQGGYRVPIEGDRADTRVLAPGYRREKYDHIERLAKEHGISTYVCACKNPDISQRLECRAGRETHFAELAGQQMLFSV